MSTPRTRSPTRLYTSRARHPAPLTVRRPSSVWSGLLNTAVPRRRRYEAFVDKYGRAVTVARPRVATRLAPGRVVVGDRVPFELAVARRGSTVWVDVHSSLAGRLVLWLVAPGGRSVNASGGGTFGRTHGPPLFVSVVGWLVRDPPSCGGPMPLAAAWRSPRLMQLPGRCVVVPVAKQVVVLIATALGGAAFVCPSCGYEGDVEGMRRHLGVSGFVGRPRYCYPGQVGRVVRLRAPSSWRSEFVARTTAGTRVAWDQLPQLEPEQLARRLQAVLDSRQRACKHFL